MISVLMPWRVRPFQVHAQQHGGPVLGFGAARARLNVEKRVVRVHLAGKHALELEPLHFGGQRRDVGLDLFGGPQVGLLGRQLQQISPASRKPLVSSIQAADHLLEFGALLAEFLRALGVVPDSGLFEFARYFLQPLVLVIVIKDTSSRSRCVPRDL